MKEKHAKEGRWNRRKWDSYINILMLDFSDMGRFNASSAASPCNGQDVPTVLRLHSFVSLSPAETFSKLQYPLATHLFTFLPSSLPHALSLLGFLFFSFVSIDCFVVKSEEICSLNSQILNSIVDLPWTTLGPTAVYPYPFFFILTLFTLPSWPLATTPFALLSLLFRSSFSH